MWKCRWLDQLKKIALRTMRNFNSSFWKTNECVSKIFNYVEFCVCMDVYYYSLLKVLVLSK